MHISHLDSTGTKTPFIQHWMAKWRVMKLVKGNGNVPYDKWYEGLAIEDQARVDAAVELIEGVSQIPPEKVKKYKDLVEIKIYGRNTALRPLGIKDVNGQIIILLVGTTKKGKILDHQYQAALKLAKAYQNGECTVRGYWET